MAQALDLVYRRTLGPDRARYLIMADGNGLGESRAWLEGLGFTVADDALWLEALTHGSMGAARNYERLEFLGDRVLGLTVAEWLFRHNGGSEGELAQRLNALVSRHSCAKVARSIEAPEHVRLGKQAREDGASQSDNVLCDVMESLLGANMIQAGFDATRALILDLWQDALEGRTGRAKHPKSALQEWAAGSGRKQPEYTLIDRSGPDHAARFTVQVAVKNVGEVSATAGSKQDAETQAAKLFMERFA